MIAFLSDWGYTSYYVGVAKAVIKRIHPDAVIIDITHGIEPFNVRMAMHVLYRASKDFLEGTVFLAVVDHGVGTARKSIVMRTKNNMFFVGPDNGIFTLVAEEYGVKEIREITNRKLYYKKDPSFTFHGRDIFAPAAAHLDKGMPMENLGTRLMSYEVLKYKRAKIDERRIVGEVAFFDSFGNIETNIPFQFFMDMGIDLDDVLTLRVGNKSFKVPFVRTYGDVSEGELLIHPDSSGFLEIAMNQGSAREYLKVEQSSEIILEKE